MVMCVRKWCPILTALLSVVIYFSHSVMQHDRPCLIYNVHEHEFNKMLCDQLFCFNFNSMQYYVCRIHMLFVITSNCLCVYSFCPEEPLIIEHKIIVAATTNLIIKYNMLLIQGKLDVINNGCYNFPCKRCLFKNLTFYNTSRGEVKLARNWKWKLLGR